MSVEPESEHAQPQPDMPPTTQAIPPQMPPPVWGGGMRTPAQPPMPPPPPPPEVRRRWLAPAIIGLVVVLVAVGIGIAINSSGASQKAVTVPDVTQISGTAARSQLEGLGFTVAFTSTADRSLPVAAQYPLAGTTLAPSSTTVTLTLSFASTPTYTYTYRPPVATAAPTTTQTPPPAAPKPLTSFGSGTYEIGNGDGQVLAGKYKTGGSDYCYWARLRALDGEFSSIISKGLPTGPTVLTIKASDKGIQVQGTCTFTKA